MEGLGDHHLSSVVGHQIDHEKGDGGQGWEPDLVPPAKIEHIISKAEEDHATNGKQRRQELRKL